MQKNENIKQFSVRLPENLHRKLKARAALEGKGLGELYEKIVKEYLSKEYPDKVNSFAK